jgi:hypothetical protein
MQNAFREYAQARGGAENAAPYLASMRRNLHDKLSDLCAKGLMNHYVNDNSDNIINEINQKIDQLDPNKSGPGVRGNSPSGPSRPDAGGGQRSIPSGANSKKRLTVPPVNPLAVVGRSDLPETLGRARATEAKFGSGHICESSSALSTTAGGVRHWLLHFLQLLPQKEVLEPLL